MPTLGDIDRHGKIQATVCRILEICVRQREASFDDGLDGELLDRAANAQTALLILDSLAKYRRSLSPPQVKAYEEQIQIRDACLTALAIENPYAESVN